MVNASFGRVLVVDGINDGNCRRWKCGVWRVGGVLVDGVGVVVLMRISLVLLVRVLVLVRVVVVVEFAVITMIKMSESDSYVVAFVVKKRVKVMRNSKQSWIAIVLKHIKSMK